MTLPPDMRGRTTQKRVSLASKLSACLVSSAVTSTPCRFSLRAMLLTSPTSTLLYLIRVLPASIPSAVLKLMVMVGPRPSKEWSASHPPISAAMAGISHTKETDQRRGGVGNASGICDSSGMRGVSLMVGRQGVPNQTRIEVECREHSQNNHRTECDCPTARVYHSERLDLY